MKFETEAVARMKERIEKLEKAGAILHDMDSDAESAIENGSLWNANISRKHIGRLRAATSYWKKALEVKP